MYLLLLLNQFSFDTTFKPSFMTISNINNYADIFFYYSTMCIKSIVYAMPFDVADKTIVKTMIILRGECRKFLYMHTKINAIYIGVLKQP